MLFCRERDQEVVLPGASSQTDDFQIIQGKKFLFRMDFLTISFYISLWSLDRWFGVLNLRWVLIKKGKSNNFFIYSNLAVIHSLLAQKAKSRLLSRLRHQFLILNYIIGQDAKLYISNYRLSFLQKYILQKWTTSIGQFFVVDHSQTKHPKVPNIS